MEQNFYVDFTAVIGDATLLSYMNLFSIPIKNFPTRNQKRI